MTTRDTEAGRRRPPSAEAIEQAAHVLADEAASPARVYLFGSHARGEATADSDVDFLVVEREVHRRRTEAARLREALPSLGSPVDVIVVSDAEVERWRDVHLHVVGRALGEGRLLAEG